MADEDMAKVKVSKDVIVRPNATSTIMYSKGFDGTAPRAHIEQIVAAGAGEAVDNQQQQQNGIRPAPKSDGST